MQFEINLFPVNFSYRMGYFGVGSVECHKKYNGLKLSSLHLSFYKSHKYHLNNIRFNRTLFNRIFNYFDYMYFYFDFLFFKSLNFYFYKINLFLEHSYYRKIYYSISSDFLFDNPTYSKIIIDIEHLSSLSFTFSKNYDLKYLKSIFLESSKEYSLEYLKSIFLNSNKDDEEELERCCPDYDLNYSPIEFTYLNETITIAQLIENKKIIIDDMLFFFIEDETNYLFGFRPLNPLFISTQKNQNYKYSLNQNNKTLFHPIYPKGISTKVKNFSQNFQIENSILVPNKNVYDSFHLVKDSNNKQFFVKDILLE